MPTRRRQGAARTLLARFDAAPAGVLIGTQMVAKGHDFDGVWLGVVLDADQTLRFPDFRAEERTFALIAQLAGRIGRGRTGRPPFSSRRWRPAPSLVFAARHDRTDFSAELNPRASGVSATRPLSRVCSVRVVCDGYAAERGPDEAAARRSRDRIRPTASGATVLGPAPFSGCAAARAPTGDQGQRPRKGLAVGAAVDEIAARRRAGSALSVDVDPQ